MTIYRKAGGAWQLATPRARIGGSAFLDRVVRVKQGGVWRQVWPFAIAGTAEVSAQRIGVAPGVVSAGNTINVVGGRGSYSYSTSRIAGDTRISVANATTSVPVAQATLGGESFASATMRTTVTDNNTGEVRTFDWVANLSSTV